MSGFKIRAVDCHGRFYRHYYEAENIADIEDQLTKAGMELIQYKHCSYKPLSLIYRRISRHNLMSFTMQLQQLLYAGIPVVEGIKDLRDALNECPMRDVLSALIASIEKGLSLSEAMKLHPHVFDKVYVTLVKVGEESGKLAEVFKRMSESLKWQDELISHTRKIAIYPAIVSLVVMGVVSFLMVFMVPQLVPFIEYSGGEIPAHTYALLATSEFIGNYGIYLAGFSLLILIAIKLTGESYYPVRLIIDRVKLNTYIIGPLLLKTSLARFANYFAMMYRAGLTVPDALMISEKLLANTVLEKSLREARRKIADGESLSGSFHSVNIFPRLVIRMIKLGESTGLLDDAMDNVSYFYNRDAKETIDKLEAMITPVLTIFLGMIMLWIMSALLGPIYEAISKIQG